jgi:O-antigen ligase
MLLTLCLAFFGIVAALVLFSLQPLLGITLVLCTVGGVVLMHRPFLGMLAYVFTVGFVAFFNFPITTDGLQLGVVVLIITTLVYLGALIVNRDWSLLRIPFSRTEHILLIAFFLVIIFSIANSRNVMQSLTGMKQITYFFLAYFIILLMVKNKKDFDRVVWMTMASGIVIGLFGVYEAFNESVYKALGDRSLFGAELGESIMKTSRGRINGMVADGDNHTIYMSFIFVLVMSLFFRVRGFWPKAAVSAALAVCFFNIFGAASRGGVIGFLVMLAVWWFAWDGRHKVIKAICIAAAGTVFVAIMVMSTNLKIDRLYTEASGVEAQTIDSRVVLIQISIAMFLDNPILGHGPRGFENEYLSSYAWKVTPRTRKVPTGSWNLYGEVLVNYGLVGATLFCLLLFFILKRLITLCIYLRGHYRGLAFSLLGIFCGFCVFASSTGFLVDLIFWLVVSLSVTFYNIFEPEIAEAKAARKESRLTAQTA